MIQNGAASIYDGIMSVAHRMGLNRGTKDVISYDVSKFLDGVSWHDSSIYCEECVTIWTHLFAERIATYESSTIDYFISFGNFMPCSADTYTSLGGSNGCADQLINWVGTKKLGQGVLTKKNPLSF